MISITNKCVLLILVVYLIKDHQCQLPGVARVKDVYFGTLIGKLTTYSHGVSGEVYAVDDSTVFVKNFNYDGQGPQAYFWAGTTPAPDDSGFIIPDEKGSTKPLSSYTNQNIVLRLPEGKTLRDINWLSVWCREFKVNFGDISVSSHKNLEIPSPVEIPALSRLAHGLQSGPITIVDAQTFLIPNFHYDGLGPAGYWWVTRGQRQGPTGLRLKDENGSPAPLRRYTGETVVISLPDDKTIYDFDWLGVWCEEFQADFGHIRIPQHIRVPPSPKMLGIKPEVSSGSGSGGGGGGGGGAGSIRAVEEGLRGKHVRKLTADELSAGSSSGGGGDGIIIISGSQLIIKLIIISGWLMIIKQLII